MTDISTDSVITPEKKVSKYASHIAYDKRRKEIDPEYKAKKNAVVVKCIKNRLQNDPEFHARYNEYQRNYIKKRREEAKMLKLQTSLQQVAIC